MADIEELKSGDGKLFYKGKPLIRKGSTLYYGSMADKYIVMLQVLNTKEDGTLPLSGKVAVYLQYTDPDVRPKDRVIRKSEKEGLYLAMDIAAIWLERALSNKF